MKIEDLIECAFDAQKNSYSPYSNFKVGCAILTKNDKVFCGTNIENASYPAGICAERVAASKAISEGENQFDTIVITATEKEFCYPCGICRQFLSEFGDMKIVVAKSKNDYKTYKLCDLLPHSFNKENL